MGASLGAIALGISAVSAVYGGVSSSSAAHKNAKLSQYYAEYNAANAAAANAYNTAAIKATSMFNAASVLAEAKANASITDKLAEYNANILRTTADYNASLVEQVSEYNSLLTEKEAYQVWDEAGLDIFRLNQEVSKVKGSMVTAYAGAGVQLNHTDTPALALADTETQRLLDVFIIQHGADIKAGKLLNAAAQGRWEGEMEANKIRFEGYSKANSLLYSAQAKNRADMLNSQFAALNSTFQGAVNIRKLNVQSGIDTAAIKFQGAADAYKYRQNGDIALVHGLLEGAAYTAESAHAYVDAVSKPTDN